MDRELNSLLHYTRGFQQLQSLRQLRQFANKQEIVLTAVRVNIVETKLSFLYGNFLP